MNSDDLDPSFMDIPEVDDEDYPFEDEDHYGEPDYSRDWDYGYDDGRPTDDHEAIEDSERDFWAPTRSNRNSSTSGPGMFLGLSLCAEEPTLDPNLVARIKKIPAKT